MRQPDVGDWKLLEQLAAGRGELVGRLESLRRRFDGNVIESNPIGLIAACDTTVHRLLLERGLGSEEKSDVDGSEASGLVIAAGEVQLPQALRELPRKHRISIPAETLGRQIHVLESWPDAIPADSLSLLRQLPRLDLFVLVSRLGHPLPGRERALAKSLSDIATLSKVLFVCLKGEEAGADDIAELGAYAKNVMQRQGFRGTRFIGAGFWRPQADGGDSVDAPDVSFVSSPLAFASLASGDMSAQVRDAAREQSFVNLLDAIRIVHRKADQPLPPLPADEAQQLTRDLDRFLHTVGTELADEASNWTTEQGTDKARRFALDAIRGWGAYITSAGHWMRHVERVRPGTQAALFTEVDRTLDTLEVQSQPTVAQPAATGSNTSAAEELESPRKITDRSPAWLREPLSVGGPLIRRIFGWRRGGFSSIDHLVTEAKSAALGLLMGVICYLALGLLFAAIPGEHFVLDLTRFIAFFLATIVGYSEARKRLFGGRAAGIPTDAPQTVRVHGWHQFQRHITSWFSDHLRRSPENQHERIAELSRRLGLLPKES